MKHKEAKKTQPTRTARKKKESKRNKNSVRSLWDNFKCSNICITRVPEREEKEQEIENLFQRTMTENVTNLMKEIDVQVQEAQRVPNKMDAKRPIPIHIIIKIPNVNMKRES